MTQLTYNGTNSADEINTKDLYDLYGQSSNGFVVNGLNGDDEITSSFVGRSGVDYIKGGNGNDSMLLYPAYRSPITSYVTFFGSYGTDSLWIPSGHSFGTIYLKDSDIFEFTVTGSLGDKTSVNVSSTVEWIDLGGRYLLTEDIFAGRYRPVPWVELYFRTYGDNADWSLNSLDTYEKLWGPILDLEGSSSKSVSSTWSQDIYWDRVVIGEDGKGVLQGKQINKKDFSAVTPSGSFVAGTAANDVIRGLAGWDNLSGNDGDDLVHGGNGRDIISGDKGSDELHGDFGWNTYKSEKDGFVDLIAVKSDHFLNNWWYGTSGNSPNGEKADIIEGLDSNDEIKIIGVATKDLSFRNSVSHKGVTGVGIYAKGILEALYTGGDLNASQIKSMTTGDASAAAMANQMWSYWGDNTPPALLA